MVGELCKQAKRNDQKDHAKDDTELYQDHSGCLLSHSSYSWYTHHKQPIINMCRRKCCTYEIPLLFQEDYYCIMSKFSSESSFPNQVAMANQLVQSVETSHEAVNATNTKSDPAMVGFGAGVHQYLNQLLTLLYSKTTTLLAANMILVSLLLSTRTSIKISLDVFYIAAVFFFSLSAIVSTVVLFPRMRHGNNKGLIFWHAILATGNIEEYQASVRNLTKLDIENEYAWDNYQISKTIRIKDALLRCAILFFICGLANAVIGVVGPMVLLHHL